MFEKMFFYETSLENSCVAWNHSLSPGHALDDKREKMLKFVENTSVSTARLYLILH